MQQEETEPAVNGEDLVKVNSNRSSHEKDAPVDQGPSTLEPVREQSSETNSGLEASDRAEPEPRQPDINAEDLDSPTLGTPGKQRPVPNVTVEEAGPQRESVQSNVTTEDSHVDDEVDGRISTSDRPVDDLTVHGTPTMGGLLLPATTFRPDARSDIGDQESIRIMLEASPVVAALPEQDEPAQQVSDEPRPVSGSENRERRLTTSPPVPPERSTSRPRPDLHPIFNHDQFHDASNRTDHAASADPSAVQHEMLDSPAYGAINGVYEHYHDRGLTSPNGVQNFQQQLSTGSPALARLGSWDSRRVTQLIFQQLHGPSSRESAVMPSTSSQGQHQTNAGLQEHLPALEIETTDIESNASELAAEEHRRAYELLESGWSSGRPSLDVDQGTASTNRASLESRGDWEEASYSIVDWMEPQAAASLDHEDPSRLCPTPPPKSPRRSLQLREPTDSPPTRSPRRRDDGGGAATPRLPAEDQPRLPEIAPTGDGLGLTITASDRKATSTPVLQPPPLPDHSPPPPPVPSFADDQPYAAVNPPGGPRSPPSPSIYSRHPMSRDYSSELSPEQFRYQFPSMRASQMSTQPLEAFTPLSAAQTQSSTSSTVREQVAAEPSAESAHEMVGTTSADDPEQKRLTKRRMLIKELLDTEKVFYNDMNIVQEIYRVSAADERQPVLNPDDVKVLFGNGDQVAAFSMDLYDALRPAAKSVYRAPRMPLQRTSVSTSNSGGTGVTDDAPAGASWMTDDDRDRQTSIGAVFAQLLSRMESVYGEYLRNHDAANKRLEKLQSIPRIREWLAACQTAAHGLTSAWSLDSLLVKPTQRISKYSLILEPLFQATPVNHPDYSALRSATMEMRAVLTRINEMKRRLELVEQVVGRKRKESDVRAGISKALGRRKEKWRQNMGLTESVDDPDFNQVAEKLGDAYFHLQIYMRDVEMYLRDVQSYVDGFRSMVQAIEGHLDVAQSSYTEIESKWRKFGIAVRELSTVALNEHVSRS